MPDGGGRKIIHAIIQAVDLEYGASVFVDYFADPRFNDEVLVTDELVTELISQRSFADAVTVTDAVFLQSVFALDLADAVAMSDAFSRTASFNRAFVDAVTMSDNAVAAMAGITNLNFVDSVTVVDAGVVEHYDYAGADYFATPFDYVGERRVF
jgi:hypothetical protein